jgi:hypothetical protein
MFPIVVLLFAGLLLALVVGSMAYLSDARTRRERSHPRYRGGRRVPW